MFEKGLRRPPKPSAGGKYRVSIIMFLKSWWLLWVSISVRNEIQFGLNAPY